MGDYGIGECCDCFVRSQGTDLIDDKYVPHARHISQLAQDTLFSLTQASVAKHQLMDQHVLAGRKKPRPKPELFNHIAEQDLGGIEIRYGLPTSRKRQVCFCGDSDAGLQIQELHAVEVDFEIKPDTPKHDVNYEERDYKNFHEPMS